MSEVSYEPGNLAREALEKERGIRVVVEKHRIDPSNYMTTHHLLNLDEAEADLWGGLARAVLDLQRQLRIEKASQASEARGNT